jgi:hypothetical protein
VFSLPAGAASLSIEPDDAIAAVAETLDVVPLSFGRFPDARAVAAARYGGAEVFFLDGNVFVEADGVWVRGGQTAAMLFAGAGGHPGVATIALGNGGAANAVTVASGDGRHDVTLRPFSDAEVIVPLAPDGTVRLEITSPAGFRPSESGNSADARYLGVRVSFP